MRTRIATFAILAAACLNACAVTILDSISAPGITAQAYRDEAALYPMVGQVSGSGFSGSGVLISDRWVLTAGHVSLGKIGATFAVAGSGYTIQQVFTHPQFTFSGPAYDLGLLYLSTPVSGVTTATMLDFLNPADLLGREGTWVGHGLTGTGLTGAQVPLEFRAFTNIIDVRGPAYGLPATSFVADFDKPDGTTNASLSDPFATRLEGNLASGDSGGGVFVTVGGARYLVGINSYAGGFAAGTNSRYGSVSGATDLDAFFPWIFQQSGIAAVPEPCLVWLLMLAIPLWPRRRAN